MNDRKLIIRYPVCGKTCSRIYRLETDAEIMGCDRCLYEVDAVEDADANPEDYGMESEES